MKRRIGNCPACGGELEFRLNGSLVTVCEYCHSVVARGDRDWREHGKVADLVQTDSPVQLGMRGRFEERSFEVVGRVQYNHPAGGVWDEFYLRVNGGRVLWLASAQGRLYVTRERKAEGESPWPEVDRLQPGAALEIAGVGRLVVAETGVAKARSAEGEIPWGFRPGAAHRFVDLHGENRVFATLGQSEPDAGLRLFLGRQVDLAELELSGGASAGEWSDQGSPERDPNRAATPTLQVNCPHCAGPLRLFAPDETQRVCCPNCQALLECDRGNLAYLHTLPKAGTRPQIGLGQTGTLRGELWTVIGYLVRFVTVGGKEYPWSEYLLYNPARGFRWLLCNQKHWALAETITAGLAPGDAEVRYQGRKFRLFDRGVAQVRTVLGEFYWKVTTDEQVRMTDYIAPPQMLSFEQSATGETQELVITRLDHVPVEEVEEGFGLTGLPRPWGVGPIQPAPVAPPGFWWMFAVTLALIWLTWSVGAMAGGGAARPSAFYTWAATLGLSAWPFWQFVRSSQFETQRWQDSPFSPQAVEGGEDHYESPGFDSE